MKLSKLQLGSIWPIDWTLSGPTALGQSGAGSDGSERVFLIPQSSSNTETWLSDCLMSYPELLLSYPCAEIQSVNSTAPADLANHGRRMKKKCYGIKNDKVFVAECNMN